MFIKVSAVHYDYYKRNIGELCEQFPHYFNKLLPLPLAIGIHTELEARTRFNAKEISVLLRIWVHRAEYIAMCQSLGARTDLDGNVQGMEKCHLDHYIHAHQRMSDGFIRRFAKHFYKARGWFPFAFVPVSKRKEIDFDHRSKHECKCGNNCERCRAATRASEASCGSESPVLSSNPSD